jgi:hypothetical protein
MMAQNKSHAVMAQRSLLNDDLDYYPTPPWATRALIEHVLNKDWLKGLSCLEPACGEGHMVRALQEYFGTVIASDIHDYGRAYHVKDFLADNFPAFDWVITNPPFNCAELFIKAATAIARDGVAMLVRTSFLESTGRYARLFSQSPPSDIAIFSERVPMVKERLDRAASSATSYAWLVWRRSGSPSLDVCHAPHFSWIPPCRKQLEKDEDYL